MPFTGIHPPTKQCLVLRAGALVKWQRPIHKPCSAAPRSSPTDMGCVPADRKAVVLKLSIRLASWRVASCLPVGDQICHCGSRGSRHEFAHMAVNSKVIADTEFKIGAQLAGHSLTSRKNRCVEQWFAQRSRRTGPRVRRGYRSAIKARSDSLQQIMLDTAHSQARSPTECS